jgi:hypothetical protein
MNCREVQKVLHDYVDSELTPEVETEVDRHLGACEVCEEHERRLRALVDEASSLPEWVEPPRDLWPGIEQRLDEADRPIPFPARRSTVPVWGYGLLAASLLIAIVAGVYINRGSGEPGPVAEQGMPSPEGRKVEEAGWQPERPTDVLAIEEAIIKNKQELREALDARRDSLDPEAAATVDKNLKLIEDAIAEIHVALDKEPSNAELNRMLMAAHQRELYLLQRAMRLAARL